MILYSVAPRSNAGLDTPSEVTVVGDEATGGSDESQHNGIPLLFITLVLYTRNLQLVLALPFVKKSLSVMIT